MWVNGPVAPGAAHRVPRHGARSVLVVVPSVAAGTRLMDVLPLLEADHRLMTVFTVAPSANGANCHGVEEFLRAAGAFVIPWAQAVRTEFDIILAANVTGLARLRGRIVLLPSRVIPGRRHPLSREALTWRGRVMPSLLVLSNDDELADLEERCPEARETAVVAGDIVYDRLRASVPFRDRYRAALGLADDDELVVLSSTWGPDSALGRHYNLADRLVAELRDDRYRVAAILHPRIWSGYGAFQVRAWLADALRKGLILLPPVEGWRATLVAADVLVGDHGPATRYGAALGPRVLLTPRRSDLRLGSAAGFGSGGTADIGPGGTAGFGSGGTAGLGSGGTAGLGSGGSAGFGSGGTASFGLGGAGDLGSGGVAGFGPGGTVGFGPGSAADLLVRSASYLRPELPLTDQIAAARGGAWQADLDAWLTVRPGGAGEVLRSSLYRLLGLPEPARAVPVSPVPLPDPITGGGGGPASDANLRRGRVRRTGHGPATRRV